MIIPLEMNSFEIKVQPLKLLAANVDTIKLGGHTYEIN